jgi:hypothetical protein
VTGIITLTYVNMTAVMYVCDAGECAIILKYAITLCMLKPEAEPGLSRFLHVIVAALGSFIIPDADYEDLFGVILL